MLGTGRDTRTRSKQYNRLLIKKVTFHTYLLLSYHIPYTQDQTIVFCIFACVLRLLTGLPAAEPDPVGPVHHPPRSHRLSAQNGVQLGRG